MKRFFAILLLLVCSASAFAQRPNSFSFDPNVFINELETYLNSATKKEVKDLGEAFSGYYRSGKLTAAQKTQIIKQSNDMLNAGCQLSPDFEAYLQTINALIDNEKLSKFDGWHKTLTAALKKSKDDFQKFLLVSKNVFFC